MLTETQVEIKDTLRGRYNLREVADERVRYFSKKIAESGVIDKHDLNNLAKWANTLEQERAIFDEMVRVLRTIDNVSNPADSEIWKALIAEIKEDEGRI
jgi:hypothetical protein